MKLWRIIKPFARPVSGIASVGRLALSRRAHRAIMAGGPLTSQALAQLLTPRRLSGLTKVTG